MGAIADELTLSLHSIEDAPDRHIPRVGLRRVPDVQSKEPVAAAFARPLAADPADNTFMTNLCRPARNHAAIDARLVAIRASTRKAQQEPNRLSIFTLTRTIPWRPRLIPGTSS
jgi:hypothetical protein